MLGYRTVNPFTVVAGAGDEMFSIVEEIFQFFDGGYGDLMFSAINSGADSAFVVRDQDTGDSADEIPSDGLRYEFGPYDVPNGVPTLFLKNGADVVVSPRLRGL